MQPALDDAPIDRGQCNAILRGNGEHVVLREKGKLCFCGPLPEPDKSVDTDGLVTRSIGGGLQPHPDGKEARLGWKTAGIVAFGGRPKAAEDQGETNPTKESGILQSRSPELEKPASSWGSRGKTGSSHSRLATSHQSGRAPELMWVGLDDN